LLSVWEPDVALVPVQPPLATQLEALDEDQLNVLDAPVATVLGIADSDTVGAAAVVTVTLTDWVAEPPGPVHVSANAEFAVNGPVVAEPDVGLLPLQLPEALQLVASAEDHVSVDADPEATADGSAVSVTVGTGGTIGGCITPMVTVWLAEPPLPEQSSV